MAIFHKLGTFRFRTCVLKCKPVLDFRSCGLKSIPVLENEWEIGGRITPISQFNKISVLIENVPWMYILFVVYRPFLHQATFRSMEK